MLEGIAVEDPMLRFDSIHEGRLQCKNSFLKILLCVKLCITSKITQSFTSAYWIWKSGTDDMKWFTSIFLLSIDLKVGNPVAVGIFRWIYYTGVEVFISCH